MAGSDIAGSLIVGQTSRIRTLGPALSFIVLLALATPSQAAPFTVTPDAANEDPSIAVDGNGVGHFAWNHEVPFTGTGTGADLLHYCQVPRNGQKCTVFKSFQLPQDDFAGPKVLLHPDGRILLVSQRCCGGNPNAGGSLDVLWVLESSDGGTTWSAPRTIGTVGPSGDAVVGPGEFSVSVISHSTTGGALYQAAPLDGYTEETANIGEAGKGVNNAAYYGTVAFADPLTPIAAVSDLDNVYFRKWGGTGNYNDLGTWGALTHVSAGDEPELVGGKRGVYLSYMTEQFPRRYVVRRWGGMGFGAVQNLTPTGSPLWSDFFQDASGRLQFVWAENSDNTIKRRFSSDGTNWSEVKTIAPENDFAYYNLETATARDGGGWAVWDGNGQGPIQAVQYGPTGPVTDDAGGDADCPLELKVGSARIVAREKCLKRIKGTQRYETTGDIRVNGIDLYTTGANAGSARAAAAATITVDKSKGILQTEGKVEAKVGNVVLDRASLEWKIPKDGGQILDLAGNPAVFETGKFKIEFLGLPVSGETSPKIKSDGSVEIPVHLGMPKPFAGFGGLGNITGDIVLRANVGQGLRLSSLTIKAKDVGLGIATIKELVIEYVGDPSRLYGKAELLLPVIQSALETEFQLKGGKFDYGKAKLTFPGQGIPVATAVYLKAINFGVATKPTKIEGGAQINGMGQVGSTPVLAVLGNVSYTFPDAPKPGVFRIEGNGKLVGVNFFNVFGQYETSGKVSFGGRVQLGDQSSLGIFGSASGAFDTSTLRFDLLGEAGVCAFSICGGAKLLISNIAVAGCLGGDAVGVGAAYVWGDGLEGFWSCDLGKYKAIPAGRIAQSGVRTVSVKGGQPLASVMVRGQGAPPRITVTGPGGQSIASGPDQSKATKTPVGVVLADIATQSTIVNLNKPQGGSWQIAVQGGSPGIASISTADALPEPSVKVAVSGKGRNRKLTWKIRKIPGQRVRIAEQGPGAYNQIVAPTTATGTVRFTPANGTKGKRRLFAFVEQDGMPRARIVAGTYVAPGPRRPSAPRFVKLRRRGGKLVVTWGRSRGAASYAVRATLKDGRRLVIPTKKRKHTIANVPGIDRGKIAVYGVAKDRITIGPPKRAGFKAKPKKRKRRRR